VNPVTKWMLLAGLAAIAAAYFAVLVWQAGPLTRVLLRRGYAQRGWDEPRLLLRIRLLGWIGLAIALVGTGTALARVLG